VFSKVDLKDLDFSKIPYYPKPPEELQEIVNLLQKSFLCTKLERQDVERIAGAMKPRVFEKGQLIIKYGDVGHEYFVLAQGSV
jgi:signal-transduction protein with cAMP-binding, CBS, and nucleotidyltransferase domain